MKGVAVKYRGYTVRGLSSHVSGEDFYRVYDREGQFRIHARTLEVARVLIRDFVREESK